MVWGLDWGAGATFDQLERQIVALPRQWRRWMPRSSQLAASTSCTATTEPPSGQRRTRSAGRVQFTAMPSLPSSTGQRPREADDAGFRGAVAAVAFRCAEALGEGDVHDAAEGVGHCRHHPRHGLLVRHAERPALRRIAGFLHLAHRFRQGFGVDVRRRDIGAFVGEQARGGAPHAARGAGDDGRLAGDGAAQFG